MPEIDSNLSVIYPETFNIHDIRAEKQAGFLDFLIPNYPNQVCTAYKIKTENENELVFEQMPADYEENIVPLTKYLQTQNGK